LMRKEHILNLFIDRVKKIVKDTEDVGWGLHDYLLGIYFDFYSDDLGPSTDYQMKKKVKL